MMQCQICGDTQGPFEIIDHKKRCVLACETCAVKNKKRNKMKQKQKEQDKTYYGNYMF